jgi:hypothetical protein
MIETAKYIGGFLRWIFKGFRTSFKDEIEGNYGAKWAGSYELENYIIGVIFAVIVIGTVIIFFFVK